MNEENIQLANNDTQVKPGYKRTEIGVIPDDWEVKTIDDVATVVGGGTPSTTCSSFWSGGSINWFTPTEIGLNKYVFSSKKKITEDGLKNSSARILPEKTILLTSRAGIGDLAILQTSSTTNQGFQSMISKDIINNEFLYYLMSISKKKILEKASGSTFLEISPNNLKSIQIPLPPLPEQKAITTVLSDADSLIQALEKKIAKKQLIKKGAMQKLLSPKEGWEVKTLGEIAKYRRGSFPQPYGLPQWYDQNNGMPFVQVYDVDKNMKLKSTTKQKISELAKNKSVFVKKGSIILTIQGSIGRIAVTQYDAYVDRTLLIFTDYSVPMDVVFFSFIVQEKFRIEKENAPGGIIKTITKEALSKFVISFPKTKEEQAGIAQILTDMDNEIELLQKKLAKYKQLKQGLMQNLLTGKIRVSNA